MSDKTRMRDRSLSKALEQTFPASDPIAGNEVDDHPVRPLERRPAAIDKSLVVKLSRAAKRKGSK